MSSALTDADQDAGLREAEFRQPAPPPIPVRKRYYITECEHCAWVGSSEQCGSYDDSMSCPVCCSEMCGDEPDDAEIAKHGEAVMQRITSAEARATAAEDKLRDREAEIGRLRAIISESATAIGNGARIGPECSLEFMAFLPREVSGVIYDLRKRISALERAALASTDHPASSEEATDVSGS